MARQEYVIEHVDGGRWLSQHGWVPDQKAALSFTTEGDAAAYTVGVVPGQRHNVVPRPAETEVVRPGAALCEYDPFGFGGRR